VVKGRGKGLSCRQKSETSIQKVQREKTQRIGPRQGGEGRKAAESHVEKRHKTVFTGKVKSGGGMKEPEPVQRGAGKLQKGDGVKPGGPFKRTEGAVGRKRTEGFKTVSRGTERETTKKNQKNKMVPLNAGRGQEKGPPQG